MNLATKAIVTVVFSLLIAGGFYFLQISPLQTELKGVEADLKTAQEEKAKVEEDIKKINELEKEVRALRAQLAETVNSTGGGFTDEDPKLFVANYIADIERLVISQQARMNDPSFTIVSIKPGSLTSGGGVTSSGGGDDDSDLEETPDPLNDIPTIDFEMNMKGRYSTIVDFLYQLGDLQLDRLVTINKITLNPISSDDYPGGLTITIPIKAYLRTGGGADSAPAPEPAELQVEEEAPAGSK